MRIQSAVACKASNCSRHVKPWVLNIVTVLVTAFGSSLHLPLVHQLRPDDLRSKHIDSMKIDCGRIFLYDFIMNSPHIAVCFGVLLLLPPSYCQTETEIPTTTIATKSPPLTSTATSSPSSVAWEKAHKAEVQQAVQRALQYLVQHRQPDWGWGNETHHVMLTLQLANNTGKEIEQQSLEMQLSAKQMEIEILLMMSK
ncbi:Uncharacterized protein CG3556 [Eumeta japonica]|uniref:Uncharacterized protein CG3556 n=1 Tax=Eumeta variegata TaxID=151549 RepID=A0A4C1TUE4_EUMVA|nr:Uncharacterized protein CG3556 [Eumeta japonica]